jgi:hypothetical protein
VVCGQITLILCSHGGHAQQIVAIRPLRKLKIVAPLAFALRINWPEHASDYKVRATILTLPAFVLTVPFDRQHAENIAWSLANCLLCIDWMAVQRVNRVFKKIDMNVRQPRTFSFWGRDQPNSGNIRWQRTSLPHQPNLRTRRIALVSYIDLHVKHS